MSIIIKNGNIFYQNKGFVSADLFIQNGKIVSVKQDLTIDKMDTLIIDADSKYVIPGLIDTHLHGCNGYDFSDGTIEAIHEMCKYELSAGITSICPATMTLPEEELIGICEAAVSYYSANTNQQHFSSKHLSDFLGFYMEGPFFSSEKAGAQRKDCMQDPNLPLFHRLTDLSHGLIKIWAFAPELPNAINFAEQVQTLYTKPILSIGHTITNKETASTAFKNGVRRITHLYNGMSNPYDVIEAALPYSDCYAELICDGIHNSDERIKYAFEKFGEDRMILISDSMRATGLGDGTYSLGGQEVYVHGKEALLHTGNKAGSVSTLFDCLKKAVSIGIPFTSVIKACTYNPAHSLGLSDKIGQINLNCHADLLILDSEYNIQQIIKNGNIIK